MGVSVVRVVRYDDCNIRLETRYADLTSLRQPYTFRLEARLATTGPGDQHARLTQKVAGGDKAICGALR
jgi:hypothetical protein